MRKRLEDAFDRFVDVREMGDFGVAQFLRNAEIDIAIDLKGHTHESRPGILAHRPAPIQVNYLGFPGTMGASYIDYLIADHIVTPPGSEQFYQEKIVRLPGSYQVNDRGRLIAPTRGGRTEHHLPEQGFVFCCFNNSFKILPEIFAIWMRLLAAVEGSVLWLLEDSQAAVRNLRVAAQKHGISQDRLIFAPRISLPDHLARHTHADLFLDTLPCNAHTTASDALWAGLPVLTSTGESFASRVAASLLMAVGLPELVTNNLADYEALALKLATEQHILTAIRERLAQNRLTTPLFDTQSFRQHIEAAYVTMWERYQNGLPAAAFDVPLQMARG
jgi:predicted O-linked N-acetylglucosamine transferase (SPINDLY family)